MLKRILEQLPSTPGYYNAGSVKMDQYKALMRTELISKGLWKSESDGRVTMMTCENNAKAEEVCVFIHFLE